MCLGAHKNNRDGSFDYLQRMFWLRKICSITLSYFEACDTFKKSHQVSTSYFGEQQRLVPACSSTQSRHIRCCSHARTDMGVYEGLGKL